MIAGSFPRGHEKHLPACCLGDQIAASTPTYGSGMDFLQDSLDPACMISDIQMPVMTGDELQAQLVASDRCFPII
jgi:FixJ family two-component response regulator